MTRTEVEELILDVLTEYLPRSITKTAKKDLAAEIITELVDCGAMDVDEDEESGEEEPVDDVTAFLRGD